jgi:hypothetical protein
MFHFQRFILLYHEDKSDMWYSSGQIYHFSIEVKDGLIAKRDYYIPKHSIRI